MLPTFQPQGTAARGVNRSYLGNVSLGSNRFETWFSRREDQLVGMVRLVPFK